MALEVTQSELLELKRIAARGITVCDIVSCVVYCKMS